MTNVRMVYLLEEQTQLNLIQLREHIKLLSLLISPRFRQDCFAGLAHDASHILDQIRWHSRKPNVESANDAQQKRGLLALAFYG